MSKNKKYMKYCNVYGCMNKARSVSESGLSFFRVPNDIERRREWLKVIDREDLTDEKNQNKTKMYSYVCSIHFDNSEIINTTIKRLKSDAVPTMFLPNKFHENIFSEEDHKSEVPLQSWKNSALVPNAAHCESQTDRKPKLEIAKPNIKSNQLMNALKQQSTVAYRKSPPTGHITDPTTSTLECLSKIRTLSNSTSTQTDVLLTSNKKIQTSTALSVSDKRSRKRKSKRETDIVKLKSKIKRLEQDSFEINKKERKNILDFRRRSC